MVEHAPADVDVAVDWRRWYNAISWKSSAKDRGENDVMSIFSITQRMEIMSKYYILS